MVSSAVTDTIKAEIAANKVMMYSKSWCPFCVKAEQLLKSKGKPFGIVQMDKVSNGEEIHTAVKALSGHRTVPAIFVGGNLIGGNSELQAFNSAGKLDGAM